MNTIVFNMDYWFIRDVVLKLDNENIINTNVKKHEGDESVKQESEEEINDNEEKKLNINNNIKII